MAKVVGSVGRTRAQGGDGLDLSRADDGIHRPIGLSEDEAVVSLEMLISGTSLVQVLVSDQFHGAAA